MDILVSAIVGDLVSRTASFVVDKYFRQQHGIDMILQRLQRVVQRIDTVVEEAEGRRITNQGMLRQLKTLRQGMYRGRYILDALRFQAALEDEEEVSQSLTAALLSDESSSLAKRLRFSGGAGGGGSSSNSDAEALLMSGASNKMQEELQRVVSSLEDTMDAGMKEFLLFLESYPRVLRQPHAAYLLLENCMFGRQTEREQVLDFLLHPAAAPILAVLPIVGPLRGGKTTLVEHVCRDENVRSRFSTILFFPEGSCLEDEGVVDLRGNGNFRVRRRNHATQSHNRLLIIVETAKDINEGAWRSLKSCLAHMAPCGGSKIIVTGRSDRIVDLGTTEALSLGRVPREAYWYFFKSLVFGSADPDKHPSMVAMAMEIASEHRQCLMGGHIVAGLLRDNFSPRFWRAILGSMRAYRKAHLVCEDGHRYHWRLGRSCGYFLICSHRQSDSSEQVPKISVQEIISRRGGTFPSGKFEALAWSSCIPPYYNYTVSCVMPAPQPTAGRKKRVVKEEGRSV
ncbi:uncharacterized protein LOC119282033 [Triticum dicoccoides]|uniref:uncharacterized protein LOC119282033 n=1 Tax=Triticum dicoccoides TaxID=85692 RepID=UPI001890A2AC|nr:uncharacterized protein LOC119282033 [Triticum dicoccoides]